MMTNCYNKDCDNKYIIWKGAGNNFIKYESIRNVQHVKRNIADYVTQYIIKI